MSEGKKFRSDKIGSQSVNARWPTVISRPEMNERQKSCKIHKRTCVEYMFITCCGEGFFYYVILMFSELLLLLLVFSKLLSGKILCVISFLLFDKVFSDWLLTK